MFVSLRCTLLTHLFTAISVVGFVRLVTAELQVGVAAVDLYEKPRHPYTVGLFRSLPDLARPGERLHTIEGTVPNPLEFPSGCKFNNRCPFVTDHCIEHEPPLRPVTEGHEAACWLLDPDGPMYDPDKVR